MRYDKIDISKSKLKERVIRKTWLLESFLDFILVALIVRSLPFISGLSLHDKLKKGEDLVCASVLFVLSLVLFSLLLYSSIKIDKLKRVIRTVKNQNRKSIKVLSEQLGWALQIRNQELSVLSPPWNWFSTNWGRQVIVVYDEQDILINAISYGLHDLKSPFHWFGNRKLERVLKNSFEKQIEPQ